MTNLQRQEAAEARIAARRAARDAEMAEFNRRTAQWRVDEDARERVEAEAEAKIAHWGTTAHLYDIGLN
jgi:hypothetical protein